MSDSVVPLVMFTNLAAFVLALNLATRWRHSARVTSVKSQQGIPGSNNHICASSVWRGEGENLREDKICRHNEKGDPRILILESTVSFASLHPVGLVNFHRAGRASQPITNMQRKWIWCSNETMWENWTKAWEFSTRRREAFSPVASWPRPPGLVQPGASARPWPGGEPRRQLAIFEAKTGRPGLGHHVEAQYKQRNSGGPKVQVAQRDPGSNF